jgi:hypothetical protein
MGLPIKLVGSVVYVRRLTACAHLHTPAHPDSDNGDLPVVSSSDGSWASYDVKAGPPEYREARKRSDPALVADGSLDCRGTA